MTTHLRVGLAAPDAYAVADAFTAGRQAGHDQCDAEILNRQFAAADPDQPFSEMARYVLVRRDDRCWLRRRTEHPRSDQEEPPSRPLEHVHA